MADVGSIGSEIDSSAIENSYERDSIFETSLVLPPYHKDPRVVEQEVKTTPLAQRILFVENKGKTEHVLVDGAVHVLQNSPEDRQKHVNFWSGRIVKMIASCAVVGALMVGTFVLGVAHTHQLEKAISCIVAFIIEAGLFTHFWKQWGEATHQVAQWKIIPANVVAHQRQEAFGVGFFSAMRLAMKGKYYQTYQGHGLLHPQELDYLYRESFKNMKKDIDKAHDLPDQAKGKCVLRFIHNNPLSLSAWQYAYDDAPSEVFSSEYERMESKILNIKEWYSDLRTNVHSHHERLARENQHRFEMAKAPFEIAYQCKVEEAKAEYEQKIAVQKAGDPSKAMLEAERDRKIYEYRALYEIALMPIKMYYDGCKQHLDSWRDGEIHRIDLDEWNYVRPLFDEVEALFYKAYARFIEGQDRSSVVTVQPTTSLYNFEEPSELPEEDLWQKVYEQKSDSPYQDFVRYARYEALKNPTTSGKEAAE